MKRILIATAALLVLAGCGGGSSGPASTGATVSPAAAAGLTYVNPANTQGQFALVLDAASTPAALVLDLVGPDQTPACGVTFGFDVDATRAAWATSPVVENGTLFTPASGTQLVQGWVNGARLQAVVANKGLAGQVADIGRSKGVIGQIRLSPVPGAAAGHVNLADNGLATLLDNTGTPSPVPVLVGSLTLN
jgi:hypothetical protein